jgi:hypothetical protein
MVDEMNRDGLDRTERATTEITARSREARRSIDGRRGPTSIRSRPSGRERFWREIDLYLAFQAIARDH